MGSFTFRRCTRADFAELAGWLAEGHVRRWWHHEFTPEAIERDFGGSVDGDEPGEDHVALLDGEPFGFVQYARFADYPEYLDELAPLLTVPDGAVTVDYFVGDPARVGLGLGTAMLAAFAERIWRVEPAATCIVVPVNSSNVASWRALRSVGFRLVARGDLEPDNPIDRPMHEVLRLDRPAGLSHAGLSHAGLSHADGVPVTRRVGR